MRVWQMQRVSAIGLLFFMTLHMVFLHYVPAPGSGDGMAFHVDFDAVIWRMATPTWKVIDVAFLFFVLIHALTGLFAVLMDVEKLNTYKKAMTWAGIVVFVLAFIYGTLTILAFQPV